VIDAEITMLNRPGSAAIAQILHDIGRWLA